MKNLENLLKFDDFEKSWKAKEQKKTKRTETGLDVIEERKKHKFLKEKIEIEEDDILDNDDVDVNVDDETEDSVWQEQLKTLIDKIIEDGEEAQEVYDYIEDYMEDEYDIFNDSTEDDKFEPIEDKFDDIDEDDLDDDEVIEDFEEEEEE